jgi:hypothetical protein
MRFRDSSALLPFIVEESTTAAAREGFVVELLDPAAG